MDDITEMMDNSTTQLFTTVAPPSERMPLDMKLPKEKV